MTYRQIPPNIFLPTDCPMKIKVSQAQSNWFVFYESGVGRCAQPQYE